MVLNKAQTIHVDDRGIREGFSFSGITVGYDWNVLIIFGTNIIRNEPAIGCELWYPVNINVNNLTQNTPNIFILYLITSNLLNLLLPFSQKSLKSLFFTY